MNPHAPVQPEYLTSRLNSDHGFRGGPTAKLHEVPGTGIDLPLTEGESVDLWTNSLRVELTALGQPEIDPGLTVAVRCLPGSAGHLQGFYLGQNFQAPSERVLTPALRGLFTAPATGTYRCALWMSGYGAGKPYDYVLRTGASLNAARVGPARTTRSAHQWTDPQPTQDRVLHGAESARVLARDLTLDEGIDTVTLLMHLNVTTCAPYDIYPGCGSTSGSGSKLGTRIEVEPLDAQGRPSGTLISGPVRETTVHWNQHHMTIEQTLEVRADQLPGRRLRASLVVEKRNDVVYSNDLRLHSIWGRINGSAKDLWAPSYGVLYQY